MPAAGRATEAALAAVGSDRCTTTVAAPAGGGANLTLWLRVLSGSAAVELAELRVVPRDRAVDGALRVGVWSSGTNTLLLSGAVSIDHATSTAAGQPEAPYHTEGLSAALEPHAAPLVLTHECAGGERGTFGVHATFLVQEHVPIHLGWVAACE